MRIYLIGFMGVGKSYWGKIWSEESGMDFFDLDEIIEAKEQLTIDEVFDKKGEAYFRKIESAILRSTKDYNNCIIACGGGTPCFNGNMEWMNENGATVFIQTEPQKLLENLTSEIKKRPLLKNLNENEMLTFIEQKLVERNPFYSVSKIILPVETLTSKTINNIKLNSYSNA